jgi:hypothetical protein
MQQAVLVAAAVAVIVFLVLASYSFLSGSGGGGPTSTVVQVPRNPEDPGKGLVNLSVDLPPSSSDGFGLPLAGVLSLVAAGITFFALQLFFSSHHDDRTDTTTTRPVGMGARRREKNRGGFDFEDVLDEQF